MRPASEIARRLYRDLVRRRAVVTVTAASAIDGVSEPPIFIIGAYRSGTTMLRYMIDSHSRICCPPESEFLLGLAAMQNDERMLSGFKQLGFDDAHVVQQFRGFIMYFFENYARAAGKPRWADKTPSYLHCLDFIQACFPEAQFLMLYRHGLDQAHSLTRGGTFARGDLADDQQPGEDLRVAATRQWVRDVAAMRAFESRHSDRCHRLNYETLCTSPEAEMRSALSFLGESYESGMLEFGNFDHTAGREDGRALAVGTVAEPSRHYLNWDPSLREECMTIAGPTLSSLGYPTS